MSIKPLSGYKTPIDGNVFEDLGFTPYQAGLLKSESQRIISARLILTRELINELTKWIEENQLTQLDAAQKLGVSRRRVAELMNRKTSKFTCDLLIGMLLRAGRTIELSIR